ncbi:MAG: diguanylate cyclase [Gammaproteobacteria bacterium]|nr:diguanylate cyclase [Gammaproteobacteria bacterium]
MVDEGSPTENWRNKYLESLEQLEIKEKVWSFSDEVLRRGLGRLALISTGVDTELDKQISALRRALQDRDNAQEIDRLVARLAEHVKALDERKTREKKHVPDPAEALALLLERFSVPKRYRRRSEKLQQKLRSSAEGVKLEEWVTEVAALLKDCLQEAVEIGGQADETGFFGRLFGRKEGAAVITPKPSTEKASVGVADDSSVAPTPRSSYIPYKEGPKENYTPHAFRIEDLFLEFLECLAFPPPFFDRVQELKQTLLEGIEAEEVRATTEAVIMLVVDMRNALEQEKAELEAFLQQMTQRLRELDNVVEGVEGHRKASFEGGKHLDAMMKAGVDEIQDAVNSATDINQLKTSIQGSLENIKQRLAEQRQHEDQRQKALEMQLMAMAQHVNIMENESRSLHLRLEEERAQALTDTLTEIPNRLAYEQRAVLEYARWQRYKHPLSLILCDVDHFKNINDTYGHKAGDRALKVIAKILKKSVRDADFLARVGGEEFAIILPETPLGDAMTVAEKLRANVQALEFAYNGTPVPITVSGGVAQFKEGDDAEKVYQRADEALYRAKKQGRNQFQSQK